MKRNRKFSLIRGEVVSGKSVGVNLGRYSCARHVSVHTP